MKQKFVDHLGYLLEKRGVQQSNLDNCLWSLDAIRTAIRRDGIYDDPHSDHSVANTPFDHFRCLDCSFGYSITCECMSHLSTLQKQAQDANKRLQALVEIRERMTEAAELMNQQLQTEANQGSSFNSWTQQSVGAEEHKNS
ncbi:hypothetical protein EON64_04470 [archaeon]|nr:MAG: hypothetical protein EON64_04470 [archaeon]